MPRPMLALLALLALQLAGRAQTDTGAPETFDAVDPYTRGKAELVDRAGYVSLGPFQIAPGIDSAEVEEVLGGLRVLWVETAHFKLGSLLQTYRRSTDDREEKKLGDELARLGKRLQRVNRSAREIDPWLRLHLYAQRLEELYADVQARAGVTDADFPGRAGPDGKPPALGSGRYLGGEHKFAVLLTERPSQLQRFARRWIGPAESSWYRAILPGNAWFLGTAAQSARDMGTQLDAALHALVATCVTYALCDGFGGQVRLRPLWFKHGLGLLQGRAADPRWCLWVPRDSTEPDDRSWLWEERLHGLVTNRFVPSWEEMLAWKDGEKLEARHHMTAWSRVSWLAESDKTAFQALVRGLSAPLDPTLAPGPAQEKLDALQREALQAAYGKTPAELDAAWRKWVLRKYPKR